MNSKYIYDIEYIDLNDGIIRILVHESDINKSADVSLSFEWEWNKSETEKIPSDINIQDIIFHEEPGDKYAVHNFVSKLADEFWLQAVINNQEYKFYDYEKV